MVVMMMMVFDIDDNEDIIVFSDTTSFSAVREASVPW